MSAVAENEAEFDQTQFNLEAWEEVLADPFVANLPHQIETDRFGNVIMSPPPGTDHGGFQGEIGHLLRLEMPTGRVLGETAVSTSDGVRAIDAGWISPERHARANQQSLYSEAPEICIEIVCPRNTPREIENKKSLYFEAGALEFWLVEKSGAVSFYTAGGDPAIRSALCPNFPTVVVLP